MHSPRYRKEIDTAGVLFILLFTVLPAFALMVSPYRFDPTYHYASPIATSDVTINKAQDNLTTSAFESPSKEQTGTLIFGPVTITREKGRPKTELFSFNVSDATGSFLLRLTRGTSECTHGVSSAVVKLNGKEIFRPSEFKHRVVELTRQVNLLLGPNLLEVRLRSAPGASVTLELYRLDNRVCPIFGPMTFMRKKGKPAEERQVFESRPRFLEPFTLNLTNGDSDGSHRVDSAIIKLNGGLVFGPHRFNEHVQSLSHVVSLQSTNTLSVELRGKPGDLLTIEITGYNSTSPSVTITSPSDGATFNASPISVSGTVDDPSSSVTVNGINTPVASNGSFTSEGVTLQEGENTIKVIATDGCGNQGEDGILVYLRTMPQGPQLIFCAVRAVPGFANLESEECDRQAFAWDFGSIVGYTDETAVSITLNGILLPDGVEIAEQGDIRWGLREGTFFTADVMIPQVDGIHLFTAVATDADGHQTEATVTFLRDTVPPGLAITSPSDGLVTSSPTITITGTVDDPEAMVYLGWDYIEIPVVNGTFTTQMTLEQEGLNYTQVVAMDPTLNGSYAGIQVTLDTIPPQIHINTPVQNATVNTLAIQVAGSIVDQNIETINVAVNNGEPQPLALTGSNFSGTVTLNPGPNTLTFSASDKAGNTSSVTRAVVLDLGAPSVNIVSPSSGTVISGTVTVQVEANDVVSGIGSVALFVDGHLFATLNQPPFNFVLDTSSLAVGPHIIMARALDKVGNQSEASITVSVPERFRVEITTPTNGATINKSMVLAQGKIYGQIGEIGVIVNGLLAEVQGDDFAAIVPLQQGQNILTATATTVEGPQVQTSVTINTESQEEVIRLTATPSSGIMDLLTNVFSVTFEAEAYLDNPVSIYSWDLNGDGVAEMTGVEPSVIWEYQSPGIYIPKVTITDNQGNAYTETTLVHVLSGEEIDALLRSKWEGMKAALSQGDVNNALNYFVKDSREEYREIFELLASQLSSLISTMREINMVEITGNMAEYYIKRFQRGVDISYFIYFMKDGDGVWKITSF